MTKIKRVVLTGSPNSGKTYLFDELKEHSMFVGAYPEGAREYFEATGILPKDVGSLSSEKYLELHKRILDIEMEQLINAEKHYPTGLTLHDRNIFDVCIFLNTGKRGLGFDFFTYLANSVAQLTQTDLRTDCLTVKLPFQFGKATTIMHNDDLFTPLHGATLELPTYKELDSQDVQLYIDLIINKVNELNGE